jgi:hypothetical protein
MKFSLRVRTAPAEDLTRFTLHETLGLAELDPQQRNNQMRPR